MKTGRPAFKPTEDHRRQVKELAAKNLSQRDTARIIGCALATFRKHFLDDFLVHSKKSAEPAPEPEAPKVKIDPKQRDRVGRLKYGGMSNEDIAGVLDVELAFLEEHFVRELKIGAAKVKAEAIDLVYDSAKAGNVQAQRKLLDMGTADGTATLAGKKEQRAAQAQKASAGKFAPPAPPKLVVNNE